MSKQKVWLEKMPKCCTDCPCEREYSCGIIGCELYDEICDETKHKDCPLLLIKDHDRELVKKVCEKIKNYCENWKQYANFYNYVKIEETSGIKVCPTLYDVLDEIQKEYEK